MFKYRRKLSHLFAYNLPRLSKLYFQDIQFQRFNPKNPKSKFTHYIMVLKHAKAKICLSSITKLIPSEIVCIKLRFHQNLILISKKIIFKQSFEWVRIYL